MNDQIERFVLVACTAFVVAFVATLAGLDAGRHSTTPGIVPWCVDPGDACLDPEAR